MKHRQLGNTGIMVSEVGFGANTVSGVGTYGSVDEADGIAAVRRAYDLGVTFFDTAEGYSEGRSEEVLGKVLAGKQDVIICSKVGGRARSLKPEVVREAIHGSLKRLQREVIDVYLIHNPPDDQVADPRYIDTLEELKRDGLIRTYGISLNMDTQIWQGEKALELGGYQALEVEFNIVLQEPEDSLLPSMAQSGVGAIIQVPLASGLLSGKYQRTSTFASSDRRALNMPKAQMDKAYEIVEKLGPLVDSEGISLAGAAIAWVLSHPEVSTVIPGCKNALQVEQNVAAGDLTLSKSVFEAARSLR